MAKECSVPDCTDRATCRGMCKKHYARWKYRQSAGIEADLGEYVKRGTKLKPRVTPEYIVCQKCGAEKHNSEFHKASRTPTLRQGHCKACRKEAASTPASRQKANVRNKRYYEANAGKCNALVMAWAKRNPDKVRGYSQEGKRQYTHRKRAATSLPITTAQLAQRWAYFGGKCWLCGSPATDLDHIKPLSKGGAHMLCNLRPACGKCNKRKSAAWPLSKVLERFPHMMSTAAA